MLHARQKLGKYRINRRLATGGFATVYQARDTVSDLPVALKVPRQEILTKSVLEAFRREVRLTARLDHPNILPFRDAGLIDGTFVIVYALGAGTLADRLQHRLSSRTALDYADQMLAAVSYAHQQGLMHCDLKPENFILFAENRLRLADFGIAKVAQRTLSASAAGTVGYLAPEQALGKPSRRSDVFALGLILYRMFSGQLPEWPFVWPPPGYDRLRRRLHPDAIALLRQALQVHSHDRFSDAEEMHAAFRRLRSVALVRSSGARPTRARRECPRCGEPVTASMHFCPWCGRRLGASTGGRTK